MGWLVVFTQLWHRQVFIICGAILLCSVTPKLILHLFRVSIEFELKGGLYDRMRKFLGYLAMTENCQIIAARGTRELESFRTQMMILLTYMRKSTLSVTTSEKKNAKFA